MVKYHLEKSGQALRHGCTSQDNPVQLAPCTPTSAFPWYWEYDIDFIRFVEEACQEQGLTLWKITPENLLESITALYKGERSFDTLLDRSPK